VTNPEEAIWVALVTDEGEGALFFPDVCRMLERLADRVGLCLKAETSTATTRVYRIPTGVNLPRKLDREVGIHRAQLVPDRSVSGRIVTAKVAVTADSMRDRATIIKTYNYPAKRVTIHETGAILDLDIVLSGSA